MTDVLDAPTASPSAAGGPRRGPRAPAPPGRGSLRWILFAAWAVFLLLPIVATVLYSLATVWRNKAFPDGFTLSWWSDTLTESRVVSALQNSVLLALATVALVTVLVLPALYWSYVRNPRLRTVMQLAALLPFALPFVVLAYGMRNLTSLTSFTEEYSASTTLLVLGHVSLAFPFFLWPVDGAMAAVDVRRLHEAAETSGASPFTTLVRVVMPNIRAGLLTGMILVFATSFGEYSIARVITGNSLETLPVWQVARLRDTRGNPNGVAVMALATLLLLLVVSAVIAVLVRGDTVRLAPGVMPGGQAADPAGRVPQERRS